MNEQDQVPEFYEAPEGSSFNPYDDEDEVGNCHGWDYL